MLHSFKVTYQENNTQLFVLINIVEVIKLKNGALNTLKNV